MTKRIITTVGASLFNNYKNKDKVIKAYPMLVKDYESIDTQYRNIEEFESSERQNSKYTSDIDHILGIIEDLWLPYAKEKASAEIETIYKIAEEEKQDLDVVLLATDTVLSVLACELIKEWFDKHPSVNEHKISCVFHINSFVVKGLQVKNAIRFENEGFHTLLEIIQKHTEKGNTLLNISGGYKAIIPFVTLFAQLEEIPLKYMYEDSDELITVGNLPFGLDWAVVEAVKPFLNPYFLANDDIQKIGQYLDDRKIEFKDKLNRFVDVDEKVSQEFKGLNIKEPLQRLFNALTNYQLIIWNSETQQVQMSALGSIIAKFKFSIETNRGYIMEHLLFRYFASSEKKGATLGYSANLSAPTNVPTTFQLDGKVIEIGDVDVWLRYKDKHNVWAEAKASSTAEGYAKEEAWNKYYKQLKSRTLALDEPFLETLFIVFRFVVVGINDTKPFANELLKTTVEHLQKLNSDLDLTGKSHFRCLGVSIPANFKGNKIDMTESFYKGDFDKWTWEEITV